MKQYETIIGLEVHVELASKSKIFCPCSNNFGDPPNTNICPVCTGMPGTLPVLNKKVVEYAIAVGLAVNCKINKYSKFDRKNYFYPDNPQNYQISQLYIPICQDGYLYIDTEEGKKRIGIHEIHMEEDAGKLIHDNEENCTLVDFNRAGVPLIEIVSKADMRNSEEVLSFLEKLRLIIHYLGASDCKLNEGSMRVDVNLSVRERGSKELGTRTEMKNLNSFKAISRAIASEEERHIKIIEGGNKIIQETRRWDDNKGCSYGMRPKEDYQYYRYFPEPDLTPIIINEVEIKRIKDKEPELRDEKKERYMMEYDIPEYDANILTFSKYLAALFENTVRLIPKPKEVSNWIIVETMRILNIKEMTPEEITLSPKNLAKLISMVEKKEINRTIAKEVLEIIFDKDIDPEKYVIEKNLVINNDEESLKGLVEGIIQLNPQSVIDYKNGKEKAFGFLVGQAMKESRGKASPVMINKLLKKELDKK